ncbi:MAG: benzoyl-CoA 2,3-epoxidase subunit BoxB, partial [Geodermatophilaceae bacterium]
TRRKDDHLLTDDTSEIEAMVDGQLNSQEVPSLLALNHDLRTEYVADCQSGVKRWNKVLEDAGLEVRLLLPHVGFNRHVGLFSGSKISPSGEVLTEDQWASRAPGWLPTPEDKTHVQSLMQPVYERGKIANWIAPPNQGINGQPFEYEYVHLA